MRYLRAGLVGGFVGAVVALPLAQLLWRLRFPADCPQTGGFSLGRPCPEPDLWPVWLLATAMCVPLAGVFAVAATHERRARGRPSLSG